MKDIYKSIEARFSWEEINNLIVIDINTDNASEEVLIAMIHMFGDYLLQVPQDKKKVFMVRLDHVKYTKGFLRAMLLHMKTKVHCDYHFGYGAINPMVLAIMKLMGTLVKNTPRVFKTKKEAISFVEKIES